jgi:hypothetical protein
MEANLLFMTSILPDDFTISSSVKFILILFAAVMIMACIARLSLGKGSELNQAISAAMGILFIYMLAVVVYSFHPENLSRFLSPLPFVSFTNDSLVLFSFRDNDFLTVCAEILSMLILAFLVNILDAKIPKGKNILSWYLLRLLTVLLAMILHYIITYLFNTFMPDALVTYAPIILLGNLVVLLSVGVLKVILGVVLTAVNPIIGAIYTFFFATMLGKQISKATLTTVLLIAVVLLLKYLGYAVISIASAALLAYIPLVIILLVLWYVIGELL